MRSIRSRKHPAGRYLTAVSIMGAALSTGVAYAETAADAPTTEITVNGHHDSYKSEVSSPKKTEALVDTPQTITVISKELLDDQNATNLVDALRNTPGITMQLGENGNTSTGDTFQLRGFSAQSSIFLDGIRDLGAISRDVYDIEQVEVAKGAAGTDIGRGASSGYINQVSKLPVPRSFDRADVSLYSQGGARGTLDSNIRTGETSGFRINLMDQDVDVPGRDRVKNSGYGIAPAYGIGLGTATRFFVFGQVIRQDNVPDGGIPVIGYPGFVNSNAFIQAGKRVDSKNYYGGANDYEKVDAAMLTTKVEHDFTNGWHLTNTSRYGQTSMDRVVTGIGNNSGGYTATSADPTTWTIVRNRQRVGQDNHILANTTNLTASIDAGGWTHDLSTGFELNYEQQKSLTFAVPTGATVTAANVYNPNPNDVMAVPQPTGAYTDGDATTVSGYVFETAKHDKWLLSAGLRVDSYTIKTNGATLTTATSNPPLPAGVLLASGLQSSGTIASWNVGAVYKPQENGSVYVAYGDSLTPPGSSNLTLSATSSNIANAAFKPTETGNLEVGTKWDALEKHLSLTAAWYDTVAKNELTLQDPVTLTYNQVGEREVTGVELGLVGQFSRQWSASAGIQTMHTEIKKGTTGNNANGASARWSPDLTATLWTTYKVSDRFTIGGGASYTSDQKLVVDPNATTQTLGLAKIPAFTVVNAMASYDLNRRVALQLNIYNLFDEDYIQSLNNGGARVFPGKPLSATLSLAVKF
jgi:catecholate siderophore receptor